MKLKIIMGLAALTMLGACAAVTEAPEHESDVIRESFTVPERWNDVVLMTGEDRDERWIEDIEQLRDVVQRQHPKFIATEPIFIPRGLLEHGESERVAWTDVPKNGLRREALENATDVLNQRLVSVGGVPIEEVERRFAFGSGCSSMIPALTKADLFFSSLPAIRKRLALSTMVSIDDEPFLPMTVSTSTSQCPITSLLSASFGRS